MTVHSASVIAAKVLFSTPVIIGPGSSVDHPATTVYSNGFETDVASWTGSPARVNMPGSSAAAHTGVYAMLTSRSSGVTDLTSSLTIAGLVVGRSYTLIVWAAGAAAGYTAKIGVTGLSTSAVATLSAYSSSANLHAAQLHVHRHSDQPRPRPHRLPRHDRRCLRRVG